MLDSKNEGELRGCNSREEDEALDDAFFSGIFKTALRTDVRYYIRKIRRHSVSSMGKATALEA